jgi:flagellar biosynthetic protein FlhB
MAFLGDNGRTEKATPKRRREARKKGQIARSPSLVAAIVFVGVFFLLSLQIPLMVQSLSSMLHRMLGQLGPVDLTEESLQKMFLRCAMDIASAVFIVAGTAIVLGVGANAAQGGLVLSGHRLAFRVENLNPGPGFKKLLPGTAGIELLKMLLTIAAVAYAAYSVYSQTLIGLPQLVLMAPTDISLRIGRMVYQFAMKSGSFLLIIGVADYLWNRRKFEKSIRMTKQEIKDEARNAEGNPEVRSKIRRKQRELALRSMMADVPKADVIITNPTHYAVALSYKPERMAAPTVVAKGKGYVALRIREIAAEKKVPLVENKPLARGLYKAVDVGQQIPAELFKAVAEVLAHVYRLKSMRL